MLRAGELVVVGPSHFSFNRAKTVAILTLGTTKTSGRKRCPEEVIFREEEVVRLISLACSANWQAGPFFQGNGKSFKAALVWLGGLVGFHHHRFTGHSLRRGGATWHFLTFSSLDATAVRGRWKHVRTARIYIAGAAAELASWRLSDEALAVLKRADAALFEAVEQGCVFEI